MKIEVSGIRVTRGEFQILLPGDSALSPPSGEEGRALLTVGCQYGILDKSGNVLAIGTASNSPSASATSIQLSQSTLAAFQNFFTQLEHDIANALEGSQEKNADRTSLEAILAGRSPNGL